MKIGKYVPPTDTSPFGIPELAANIFTNLNGLDLVQVSRVCRKWRAYVFHLRTLQSFLFKFSEPCIEAQNPHFEEPCKAYKELEGEWHKFETQIPNASNDGPGNLVARNLPIIAVRTGLYIGWPVLRAIQEVNVKLLPTVRHGDPIHSGPDCCDCKLCGIRASFKGVRFPNGWPVGLREIHCDICDGIHTRFRYKHLHPVLRFLEDMTVCLRGQGSRLCIDIGTMADVIAPRACFEHFHDEMMEFGRYLRVAFEMVHASGARDEFATRPLITKLVHFGGDKRFSDEYTVIEDVAGLTLGKVVPFLVQSFRQHLSVSMAMLHAQLDGRMTRKPNGEPHLKAAYAGNLFEHHMANYSQIVEMFAQGVAAVDAIMFGVDSWEPIVSKNAQEA